jgi:EpsI family protein
MDYAVREGLVVLLLAGQALLVHWAAGNERPPAVPDLAKFPASLGAWTKLNEDPIEESVQQQLRADSILSRNYSNPSQASIANLFVAWFQSQSRGDRQPHSPRVCLPGAGWIPELTDEVTLRTAAGAITANRYVVINGAQRAVVLYWYQTPQRVIDGEWPAKLWAISDAIRYRRTDTALVRVVTWVPAVKDGVSAATAAGAAFAQDVYPLLRESLPK